MSLTKNPQIDKGKLEAMLNLLGNEGWELVRNLPRTAVAAESQMIFIFKREK